MLLRSQLRHLLALAISLIATPPALAIGVTPPSWEPRETVTDTLADRLAHFGAHRILAYDHHGDPGIAFFDDVDDKLRYARRLPGVGWFHMTVDDLGAVGGAPSLAYDRYERPAISYFDFTNGDLKYARLDGTTWLIETMTDSADSVGSHSSLAFDRLGRPAIAYLDGTNASLKYVADTDGDFSLVDELPMTVASEFDEGLTPSLAFDLRNRPMIAHQDYENDDLRFSIMDPGVGWATTTVDAAGVTGYLPSLAAHRDTGYPAIAYFDSDAEDLRFAAWNGDSWDLSTVDSEGVVGDFPSLAFDPADGNPAIAYFSLNDQDLKLPPG